MLHIRQFDCSTDHHKAVKPVWNVTTLVFPVFLVSLLWVFYMDAMQVSRKNAVATYIHNYTHNDNDFIIDVAIPHCMYAPSYATFPIFLPPAVGFKVCKQAQDTTYSYSMDE